MEEGDCAFVGVVSGPRHRCNICRSTVDMSFFSRWYMARFPSLSTKIYFRMGGMTREDGTIWTYIYDDVHCVLPLLYERMDHWNLKKEKVFWWRTKKTRTYSSTDVGRMPCQMYEFTTNSQSIYSNGHLFCLVISSSISKANITAITL